ncbi:MAG: outer membrane protein assembly factor BamA [Pelagibacteraceae bacterium]|jgi:outer membrane protein insertion porin family|nr:outer membrane protein assembly factor BamA [Pelagibacteraceae bacterium]MDP6709796.1 outer membrane protein assembly factor BamA [Pelagibacteraceae bacterium]
MANYKKILVGFILFILAFSVKSYSEMVNKVEVKGNQRITLETIIIFGDIKTGENYDEIDISLLIKKLYETNFFSNISAELINNQLIINVEENPIINSIVFKGEKADKYREGINKIITLKEKTSFLRNIVKSDINKIREFYRYLGFYFVKIDLEIEKLDKNRVNLIYSINKGEKAKIAKIYFLGDKKMRNRKLSDIITSQENTFWKIFSKNVYLSKERVELDKRLLKRYYKNKGYYEVDISSSNVEYSKGEGFVLTFSINAGKRYRFKKISANVAKALDKSAFIPLQTEFNKIIGKYYSEKKLTAILEKIDKLSEQKELQFINHRLDETLEADGVAVVIDIFEGRKFTVERINIKGNNVTNDAVIRSEMLIDEGDPYSALLLNKSINNLKARGIFGKIEKKILEGSSPDSKILEVKVEEKATGEIMAGAGVGTDGTSVMFAVKENNWLGKGINLQSSISLNAQSISGSIALRNPNYNYTGNAVFSSLDISSMDKTTNSGFESTTTGFSFGTEFEQYEGVFLSPTISAKFEKIDVQSSASDKIKKMEGNYKNVDFNYSITLDKRDQRFETTSGHKISFVQSLPIVRDSSSILNGLTASKYFEFSEDVIGALRIYGRSLHGIDDDVRLSERLFIPQRRLRGFDTSKVGPKDESDWIGGNFATAVGFEAKLPNLLPESLKTNVSAFIDTANLWGVDYSDSVNDSNKIRSSVGLAVDVWTMVGPLSFTAAKAITTYDQDETETFNFRLGTSF